MMQCMHFAREMRLRDAVHAFCRTGAFACCNACILQGRMCLRAVMQCIFAREDASA